MVSASDYGHFAPTAELLSNGGAILSLSYFFAFQIVFLPFLPFTFLLLLLSLHPYYKTYNA